MALKHREFSLNFKNKLEIDVSGNADIEAVEDDNMAVLAAGINSITPAASDTTDATAYWDGEGFTDTEVTGKEVTFAIAGHRVFGDEAQDYVAGKFLDIGDSLRTVSRWTDPEGNVVESVSTLTAIVPFGGNANEKQTFSFTLTLNGKPEYTPAGGGSGE